MLKTEADRFCERVLADMEGDKTFGTFDEAEVDRRFNQHPELLPNTLHDCLRELGFWHEIYRLHSACSEHGEPPPESLEREHFAFRQFAVIRPRNKDEAKDVLRYLIQRDRKGDQEFDSILENLIAC